MARGKDWILYVLMFSRGRSRKGNGDRQILCVCTHMGIHAHMHTNTHTNTYFNNQLNAQFLYSLTVCMLHYNPRHISSINVPIFRRKNCIITASGIVTHCKWLYSMPDESSLLCRLLSSGILYSHLQWLTIPDAVIIQFFLLKMGMLMLETCRGL